MFFVCGLVSVTFNKASRSAPEYHVVLANTSFVTVNSASYPDCTFSPAHVQLVASLISSLSLIVFWALRGGGAGSWGVIVDATFRTYPTFNATIHTVNVQTASLDQTGNLMTTHATHIKDWDAVKASQYFYLTGSASNANLALYTIFKDLDGDASKAQMSSFLDDARALGVVVQEESTDTATANDIATSTDDYSGFNEVMSSRLVPNSVYLNSPNNVGAAYQQLFSQGASAVLGSLVAGGVFPYSCFPPECHVDRSRRPSRRQRQYQLGNPSCMALCEDPCERLIRWSDRDSDTSG